MLHFESENFPQRDWCADERQESSAIAHRFLADEGSLLRLTGDKGGLGTRISEFVDAAAATQLTVARASSGEILLRVPAPGPELLLTGRTANVLGLYLDHKPVRMWERQEMTQRRAALIL